MRIIDTHVHVWDLEKAAYPWLEGDQSILNRTWRIEEIADERKKVGITTGVLVQASGNLEDTELLLDTAYKTDWISGVVAWMPLMHPQMTRRLLEERFLQEKYFKGVRHQIHDEKNTEWLLQPNVIESLKDVASYRIPYDIVGILPAHIETVLKLAEKIPELKMVFDHLSAPPVPAKERFGKWGDLMKEAAKHKNFFIKISGLGTASGNFKGRTANDITPYVEFVLEHFGVERCFCGSDWPVSMLANDYVQTWKTTKEILNSLLDNDAKDKVFFTNANSFYNLGLS